LKPSAPHWNSCALNYPVTKGLELYFQCRNRERETASTISDATLLLIRNCIIYATNKQVTWIITGAAIADIIIGGMIPTLRFFSDPDASEMQLSFFSILQFEPSSIFVNVPLVYVTIKVPPNIWMTLNFCPQLPLSPCLNAPSQES